MIAHATSDTQALGIRDSIDRLLKEDSEKSFFKGVIPMILDECHDDTAEIADYFQCMRDIIEKKKCSIYQAVREASEKKIEQDRIYNALRAISLKDNNKFMHNGMILGMAY